MVYLQMQNRQRFAIFIFVRLTLSLSGRQEAIAIEAGFTAACPLEGHVRRPQDYMNARVAKLGQYIQCILKPAFPVLISIKSTCLLWIRDDLKAAREMLPPLLN
jgi:hypothetical protein